MSSESSNSSQAANADLSILTFHKTSDRFSFGSTNLSPARFIALLSFLKEHNYDFADPRVLTSSEAVPPRTILITFDDCYRHILPVLEIARARFDLRPVVFVPTAFIGETNSWDYSHRLQPLEHMDEPEIRRLIDIGAEIGSHGHTHTDLTRMPEEKARQELVQSKSVLEEITGREISWVSYPFGRHNEIIRRLAHEAGFERGFGMSYSDPSDKSVATGRMAVYGYDTNLAVLAKLRGGLPRQIEMWKSVVTNKLASGTTFYNHLFGRVES